MLPPRNDIIRTVGLALAALACLATSAPPPRPPRPFLAWQLEGADVRFGCLAARAWVSKSGREGVGVTIRLENVSEVACVVAVTRATFSVGEMELGAVEAPPLLDENGAAVDGALAAHTVRFAYVAWSFDNSPAARAKPNGELGAAFTVDGLAASLAARAHQGMVQRSEPYGR